MIGDSTLPAKPSIVSRTIQEGRFIKYNRSLRFDTFILFDGQFIEVGVPAHNLGLTELHACDNCRHRPSPGNVLSRLPLSKLPAQSVEIHVGRGSAKHNSTSRETRVLQHSPPMATERKICRPKSAALLETSAALISLLSGTEIRDTVFPI